MTIDSGGNVGIGTSTFGTNAETALAIAEGVTPTTSPAGMVQLYVQPDSGLAELYVLDESGTTTQLSDHALSYPVELAVDEEFPRVKRDRQNYLGHERYIALGKMAQLVEKLAKQAGFLPEDRYIVMKRPIPKRDWDADEQAAYDRRKGKIAAANAQIETLNAELADMPDDYTHAAQRATLVERIDAVAVPGQYIKRPKPAFLEAK